MCIQNDIQASEASANDTNELDLFLSGGGFRATLFHLGVVIYLVSKRRLREVTHIYGVSGGAFVAAHLVLKWNDYCPDGNLPDPQELGRTIRAFLWPIRWFSIRDSVFCLAAMLWLAPFVLALAAVWRGFDVSGLSLLALGIVVACYFIQRPLSPRLARLHYHILFRFTAKWHDLRDSPNLHILATDLITGKQVEFSQEGLRFVGEAVSQLAGVRQRNRPISDAITASASFPPAFPPWVISKDTEQFVLTDGGVYDNLGTRAKRATCPCITSDAGGQLVNKGSAVRYNFVLMRNVRASDILMTRLSDEESSEPKIKIGDANDTRPGLTDAVRVDVARIRTDLNRFSRKEITALVLHGFYGADEKLRNTYGALTEDEFQFARRSLSVGLGVSDDALNVDGLRGSDKTPLWLFLPIVLLYCLILLGCSYFAGGVPEERVFGAIYNTVAGSPSLECLGDCDSVMNGLVDQSEVLELYWTTRFGLADGLYYKTTEIAGLADKACLNVKFPAGTLSHGHDAFAILVRSAGRSEETVWLQVSAVNDATLAIAVPPFRGRGVIRFFVENKQPAIGTCW